MGFEIEIPSELASLLLERCAVTELSLEELIARAITNFMKRNDENGH